MKVNRIHHVAYRCKDAKQTVDWYVKHLNMDFVLAIAEDLVPSTKAPDPYMHVFLDAGNGNVLAFFELPTAPEMGRDINTPDWVQHIAFKVDSLDDLEVAKSRLQASGIDVIGVTDHTIFKSIYFFDPNGHRLELACDNGERVRVAFALDCCDREVISWVATTKGIDAGLVGDLMVQAVENRFGANGQPPKIING